MSCGFEEGKIYNRRADIHAKFEGQRQGGIITPAQHPIVIMITGEEGLAHGYADRSRDDEYSNILARARSATWFFNAATSQ